MCWTFVLAIVCILFCSIHAPFTNWKFQTKVMNFSSITHFEHIEEYYQGLRRQRIGRSPKESRRSNKKVFVKKGICRSIFTSYYFKMRRERYVNLDSEAAREELKTNYRDIYDAIFKKSNSFWNDRYEYKNPYRSRTVRVNNRDENEYTIICPVRRVGEDGTEKIDVYFVTQQYNVNECAEAVPIFARFIFVTHEDGHIRLVAMAEEAARQSALFRKPTMIESTYLTEMGHHLPSQTPNHDPVCKLSEVRKLRLCASLFGSPVLKWKMKLKFAPVMSNVHVGCLKKKIVFKSSESRSFMASMVRDLIEPGRSYEEWMIGCKALNEQGNEVMYYVSRASVVNEVFVYIPNIDTETQEIPVDDETPERVYLYNLFYNVSVIDQALVNVPRSFITDNVEE